MKKGKRYLDAASKVDRQRLYTPLEAVRVAQQATVAKFDETVEVHFRLGIDTRQADQQVRGSVSLPHGTGKTVRVAVFAEGDKAREIQPADFAMNLNPPRPFTEYGRRAAATQWAQRGHRRN